MRRVLTLLLALFLVAPPFSYSGDPDTINTVPSATSSFITDLQSFLREEDGDRFSEQFTDFVVSGGTHGTVAGLTGTPTALVAYPGGGRITESGSITYPDNDTCWVIASRPTTGNLGTYTRVAGTHYLTDCASASLPALPADTVQLMDVTTLGGAITAVIDLRILSPISGGQFLLPAYAQASLPAAGTKGRLARVTDNQRGVWMDQEQQWFPLAAKVVNVMEFGAICDGTVNPLSDRYATLALAQVDYPHASALTEEIDWAAIQGAVNSLNATRGGKIVVPAGVCVTSQEIHIDNILAVIFEGQGHTFGTSGQSEGTVIIKNGALAEPIIRGSFAKRLQIRDISLGHGGTAVSGQDCIQLDATAGEFSRNVHIQRVSLYDCWNGINVDGGSTGSVFENMYISRAQNNGIRTNGAQGASIWRNIYITGALNDGINGQASTCVMDSVITENITRDGLNGTFSRCTFNGMYFGDTNGRYGINWLSSTGNIITSANFIGQVSSAMYLDSSYDNQFYNLAVEGLTGAYVVEVANSAALSADKLQMANKVVAMTTNTGPTVALTNDFSQVLFEGVSNVFADVYTFSFPLVQQGGNRWSWVTRTIPAADYDTIDDAGPGTPNTNERWSYYAHLPGGLQQTETFAFVGRNATNNIFVLPATETLGSGLITGDDSTFTATVGSWTPTNGTFVVSGGRGLFTANGVANGRILLAVGSLDTDKLYKLTFNIATGSANTGLLQPHVRGTVSGNELIRIAPSNSTTAIGTTQVAYFIPDAASIDILIVLSNPVNLDTFQVDNFVLTEVTSAAVLQLSGGRKAGVTAGGGGTISLYGAEHATKPSVVEFQGAEVHSIQTLANDATPSIKGGRVWLTGGTTTITDFDDGITGQIITIISEHAITITDGTNIFLSGSVNFVMAATDTLTLIQKADGLWYEIGRSDNT